MESSMMVTYLSILLPHLHVELLVVFVELGQLLALRDLELLDLYFDKVSEIKKKDLVTYALVEARRVLELDHLDLLHNLLFEVFVAD